jgi:hypothetical protein
MIFALDFLVLDYFEQKPVFFICTQSNNTIEQVVGVPVTLNGDLKNQFVETTVGFDTICKVKNFISQTMELHPSSCMYVVDHFSLHFLSNSLVLLGHLRTPQLHKCAYQGR